MNKLLVVLGLVLTLGCASQIPAKAGGADYFKELAAKGYRWVTVNGPYACATKQKLRNVVSINDSISAWNLLMNDLHRPYDVAEASDHIVISRTKINELCDPICIEIDVNTTPSLFIKKECIRAKIG